jgi:hypothetical protein
MTGPRDPDRLPEPPTEKVNWPARYGDSVRTILEVRWLAADTFQVIRERWDPAHPETVPGRS